MKKKSQGFTAEERAAMRDHVKELRAAAQRRPGADGQEAEREVLAKIDELPEKDRAMGKRLHGLIKSSAPQLSARLWYGMPAYSKDGKIVCHFQPASKFKTRYATLGFSDNANLDDGEVWPVAYAINKLTAATEARIAALVKNAVR